MAGEMDADFLENDKFGENFALRTGYFNESEEKGSRRYLTFGAGFKYNNTNNWNTIWSRSGNSGTRNWQQNTVFFQNFGNTILFRYKKLSKTFTIIIHCPFIHSMPASMEISNFASTSCCPSNSQGSLCCLTATIAINKISELGGQYFSKFFS